MRYALILAALVAACGGDGEGGKADAGPGGGTPDASTPGGGDPDAAPVPLPGDPVIEGSVVGASAPANGRVVAVWALANDYYYKFGEGASVGAHFGLAVSGNPPEAALASSGVGMGFLLLLPPHVQVTDGLVDVEELEILGIAAQHFLVWKQAGATDTSWSAAFPAGYSCAKCVPGGGSGGRDGLVPVDCKQAQIEAPPASPECRF